MLAVGVVECDLKRQGQWGPDVGYGVVLGHQQAAGGGGHHAEGQYGDRVCTVGLMEFVLEKGTVGDLSLVLGGSEDA